MILNPNRAATRVAPTNQTTEGGVESKLPHPLPNTGRAAAEAVVGGNSYGQYR